MENEDTTPPNSPNLGQYSPLPHEEQPATAPTNTNPTPRLWGKAGGVLTAVAVGSALLGGVAGGATVAALNNTPSHSSSTAPHVDILSPPPTGTQGTPASTGFSTAIERIADRTLPGVVSIETYTKEDTKVGTGSGFFYSKQPSPGNTQYILTNNHVVENADTFTVYTNDGKKHEATLVGVAPDYDLAVLEVKGDNLGPSLTFADVTTIHVGAPVVAFGSPLGLQGTVTSGIISALNRPVTAGSVDTPDTTFIEAIQTDAAINPGNSGGPLVNLQGQVVGVNSAIATAGGQGNIGLGFAIPSDVAQRVADSLIEKGSVPTPRIGVEIDTEYQGEGVKVRAVTPGSAGESAGLKPGDVIVAVDGKPLTDPISLVTSIRSLGPNEEIALTLQDGTVVELVPDLVDNTVT